jgi:putative two-component system response regulator
LSSPLDFSEKRNVLVVDDTPDNLTVISNVLKQDYKVRAAPSGERALQIAFSDNPPDLILLDIMMPGMDGYEVLRQIQANPKTNGIPVIFVTAMDQEKNEEYGIDLGAVDYITKPISPAILMARVRNHLLLKDAKDFLKDQKIFLEREVASIQDVAIHAFGSLAETRDDETVNHIRRTQNYVRLLAETLKGHPRFSSFLTDQTIILLAKSAPLHDIGKVGIPDRILLKAGALEPEEFEIMKTHTTIGRDAIERAERALGSGAEFLRYAKEIAYSHHERWDGEGYPQGLKGEAIPISARLMALADVYDILISRRPHKSPIPHDEAVQIINAVKNTHFDPDVADAFLQVQKEFHDIATRHADNDSDVQKQMQRPFSSP